MSSALAPLTPFDRFIARLLRYDVSAQDERIAKTEAIRQFSIRSRLNAERFVRDYEQAEKHRVGR